MSQLNFYLPPFSSDYAGACSALFDLNALIVVNDGFCCTRIYASCDEPRWYGHKRPTFSSALREIDVVMGEGEDLINKTKKALEVIDQPDFIALLNSPVPALTGSNVKWIASKVEEETGIPTFGFETTGFHYYNKGIEDTMLTLVKQYTKPPINSRKSTVNILGLTPLDYSDNENASNIKNMIEKEGLDILCSFMMDGTLKEIEEASEANANLVVSASGMKLAKFMNEQWGIPYVVGTPVGTDREALTRLREMAEKGYTPMPTSSSAEEGGVLIIGDQVIANSLRRLLIKMGITRVTVGTFFGLNREIAEPFDLDLMSEKHLIQSVEDSKFMVD